jgi:hypothetical protein
MDEMDKCNFVIKSARCKELTQVEVLRKLCGDTSDVIRTSRPPGKAHFGLSKVIEAFLPGYKTYHRHWFLTLENSSRLLL